MKIRFWDRVLVTLYVILSLVLCVCVGLRTLGIDLVGQFYSTLTHATAYWYLIYFGIVLIIVLLGVYTLKLCFARKGKSSNFVTVDQGDNGKVIISMDALESMVRQSITDNDGIADMSIDVKGHEDSISVFVDLTAEGGAHLPTITMNLQRDIRTYVEVNCGVAVRDVTVKVTNVLPPEGVKIPEKKTHERKRKKAEGTPVIEEQTPVSNSWSDRDSLTNAEPEPQFIAEPVSADSITRNAEPVAEAAEGAEEEIYKPTLVLNVNETQTSSEPEEAEYPSLDEEEDDWDRD